MAMCWTCRALLLHCIACVRSGPHPPEAHLGNASSGMRVSFILFDARFSSSFQVNRYLPRSHCLAENSANLSMIRTL
jgi:hypothetical protein